MPLSSVEDDMLFSSGGEGGEMIDTHAHYKHAFIRYMIV